MRLVVQRVSSASVTVDGQTRASIGTGLLVLVGFVDGDVPAMVDWSAEKLSTLRIFPDEQGKMNLSVADVAGGILLVPNFTLAGDASKGRRPSFDKAMPPAEASTHFDRLCELVAARGIVTQRGVFREHMHIALVNDGPVTIVIDAPA